MKFRFFILLAAAGVLAACAKEETGTSESGQGGKIVAQFGVGLSDVKTTLGPAENAKRKIFWAAGDCIAINGLASEPLTEEAAGGVTAVFDFTEYYTKPCNVLYPSVMYKDESTITLPDTQEYEADGFASGAYPMAAYTEDASGATLAPLCAMIKLPIKRAAGTSPDTDRVATITFTGNAGEQVCGDFTIDYANATLTGASDAEADKSLVINVKHTPGSEPLPIVLVIPAGTYDSGFSIKVVDVAGHYMELSKDVSFTVEAGHLYVMPEFEFIPTGTELGVQISSAADLIAFAQNYNSKAVSANAIATLTADIEFDAESSAAFNATGGIGMKKGEYNDTEDYYFDGLLNGNGKTISGLASTVSLFKAIGSSGKVQDLTLDNTCSFTFSHRKSVELYAAAVVGYHKGLLDNVNSAADVTLAPVSDVTAMTTVGGLAGRVTVGTLQNCEYSGLISTPADFKGTGKLIIGGIVGRFTNEGIIKDSYFRGAISNAARITSSDKSNPYTIIGGIAGHVNGGATLFAANATADHEAVPSAYDGLSGTIVSKSTIAHHSAIGGLVGELYKGVVYDCKNSATIAVSIFRGGDATGRYIKSGGIVGKCAKEGSIEGCENNGTVEHRSNPRIQDMGGIVGYNDGTVTSCTNNAAVSQMSSGQAIKAGRVVSLGGIIGQNTATALVTDVHNTANIEISSMEDGTSSQVRIGGVIGLNYAEIDGGESKNITNHGQVYFSPNFSNQFLGYALGGIVGDTKASIYNVKNLGTVYFRWNSADNAIGKAYLGGIVGSVSGESALTLSGCENAHTTGTEGQVYFRVGPGTGNFIGGILGYAETDVTLSECTNAGYIDYKLNYLLTDATIDGGVGGVIGSHAAGKKVSLLDCTNVGEVFFDKGNSGGTAEKDEGKFTDSYAGGIMAKGADVVIDGCANAGYVHGGNDIRHNNTASYVGGIVAYVTGASSILNCKNTGNVFNIDNNNSDGYKETPYAGGIAGFAEGTEMSPLIIGGDNGCIVDAASIRSQRGWVAGAVAYAKYVNISSCTVKQSISVSACHYAAGILGQAQNCNILSCAFEGATLHANNAVGTGIGGIVAKMDNSVVDGCASYATAFEMTGENVAGGAVVGISESGNIIRNCHYKPTINDAPANIAGTGSFTDGGGNVADL